MEYIGEHLLPGKLGHFFAILSLIASLLATIAYWKANRITITDQKQSWLRLARGLFLFETISVIAMFCILYYVISHHLFEYKYAWQHSDKSLQVEYLLSCFWEGQEGSFMLWSFWHCVLGWLLIWKSKNWEAGVMTVISFAQFCLATMLIGVYFFGSKVGSSPFVLLRNEMEAPIFTRPDYLNLVKDGTGLNTLLQNYWMVIHPPVLFLGFASTIVPFAFAFAGLVNKDHTWIKQSLPWTAFSVAVLGLGIMMGAMWAYESLSFGGYWAWDPVENASLVPWLTLVAGLHTNLIYKHSGYSLRSTYFFYIISFSLILYSTFLTRSGVLGDTSVHAFTDLGMNFQLTAFLLIFVIPALVLFFVRYKSIPAIRKEENTYSREFWMFIGSLVLFLSAAIIIIVTSLPVFNKIVNHVDFLKRIVKNAFAQPEDVEFTHNQVQVFVAIVLGLLTAVTQYFKYKDTPKAFFGKKIWIPTLLSLIITLLIVFFGHINYDKKGPGFLIAIHLAIFASSYAVIANAGYIWLGLKGKIKAAGASVAHVGFGMILLGVLISSGKKTIISQNTTGISPLKATKQENPAENITLFKGVATDMGKYMVTYHSDTLNTKDRKRYFRIDFKSKKDSSVFSVYPDVIKNNKGNEGFAANPDAKHCLTKDIFVYITSFQEDNKEDTTGFRNQQLHVGDTIFYSKGLIILNGISVNLTKEQAALLQPDEKAAFLDLTVISKDSSHYKATPGAAALGNNLRSLPDTVLAQNLVLRFNNVITTDKERKIEIGIKESKNLTSLLTLKVLEFPMIKILWIGVILMVIGCVMSIVQRVKQSAK